MDLLVPRRDVRPWTPGRCLRRALTDLRPPVGWGALRVRPVIAALCVLATASGCGYRFAAGGPAVLPEGIGAVRAPLFGNLTPEPGLEVVFTEALRQELARAGIETRAGAEAELTGDITNVSGVPTVLTTPTGAPGDTVSKLASYRIFATAHLKLTRGTRVVSEFDVSGYEDYLPGVDILQSESNRQAALERLAQRLMRDAFDRLATR
ncbi:MAG: hypothetical protein IRZ16_10895 [Myxococcaceae bacterium]|nr:hypothetical protein [Myxococcaceae bacterium]